MNPIIKDCITGISGEDYDVIRVLLVISVIFFFLFSGWHLLYDHIFSAMDFGTGLAAIFTGAGAGIGFKAKTEPQ